MRLWKEWLSNKLLIVRISLKYMYLKLLQKIYLPVVYRGNGKYDIQYTLKNNIYIFRTTARRGPSTICCITDHNNNDVTDEVKSYLGPNEDCHGQPLTPRDIGYKKGLCIEYRSGKKVFYKGETFFFCREDNTK